mmetsp:Transcript_60728/g.166373  ORF Transcript_60728/g.166373 Transcript_60728/m.166373 type:complete len:257 (-) Transcript_60728:1005-1775(-)
MHLCRGRRMAPVARVQLESPNGGVQVTAHPTQIVRAARFALGRGRVGARAVEVNVADGAPRRAASRVLAGLALKAAGTTLRRLIVARTAWLAHAAPLAVLKRTRTAGATLSAPRGIRECARVAAMAVAGLRCRLVLTNGATDAGAAAGGRLKCATWACSTSSLARIGGERSGAAGTTLAIAAVGITCSAPARPVLQRLTAERACGVAVIECDALAVQLQLHDKCPVSRHCQVDDLVDAAPDVPVEVLLRSVACYVE